MEKHMNHSFNNIDRVLELITQTVVGEFNRTELLGKILDAVLGIFDAEVCTIFLRNEKDPNIVECVAGKGYGIILAANKRGYNLRNEELGLEKRSFTGHIASTGKEYNIKNRKHMEELVQNGLPLAKKHNDEIWGKEKDEMRNIMALPLKIRGDVIGVIKVENKKGDEDFSDVDFSTLKTIRAVLSLAIENAKLYSIYEKQQKSLIDDLANVVTSVVGNFDKKTLLNKILKRMMETFYADVCSIYLVDDKNKNLLTCVAGKGFADTIVGEFYNIVDDAESLTVTVYQNREPVKVDSPEQLNELKQKKNWKGKLDHKQWSDDRVFRNLLAIPLVINNECLGLIKLENKDQSKSEYFTDEDMNHFLIVANIIALAIKNYSLQDDNSRQLKTISAKATHRLHNQVLRYDFVEAMMQRNLSQQNNTDEIKINKDIFLGYIQKLKDTTKNIKNTIADIGKYAKPIELSLEEVDINDYITDFIKLIKEEQETVIDNKVEILEELENGLSKVFIDKDKIFDVIHEFIKNSLKSFEREKTENPKKYLTVRPRILISTKKDHFKNNINSVKISITDNGPGLPKDINIFEPFISSELHGTGLGLSINKEIIEKHEGVILINNNENTTFEIFLPINDNNH